MKWFILMKLAPNLAVPVTEGMIWSADNLDHLNLAMFIIGNFEVDIASKYLESEFAFINYNESNRDLCTLAVPKFILLKFANFF